MMIARNAHQPYLPAHLKAAVSPPPSTVSSTNYVELLAASRQICSAFERLNGSPPRRDLCRPELPANSWTTGLLPGGNGKIHPAAAIDLPASYFDWSLIRDRHAIFRGNGG